MNFYFSLCVKNLRMHAEFSRMASIRIAEKHFRGRVFIRAHYFETHHSIFRLFVALSGIQYVGSHLKGLQRALKNPASNLGLVFKEASKRVYLKASIGGVMIPYNMVYHHTTAKGVLILTNVLR